MQIGLIYKATNTFNGKTYVGQTTKTLAERMKNHRQMSRYTKRNKCKFYKAINKYGWDAFEWKVVLTCPVEDLDMQETITIEALDTYYSGYNSTAGGLRCQMSPEIKRKISESQMGEKNHMYGKHPSAETIVKLKARSAGSNNGRFGKPVSEVTRKKQSDAAKRRAALSVSQTGNAATPEVRQKISAANSGESNSFFGKHHTEETKLKMKAAWANRKPDSEETKTKKREAAKHRPPISEATRQKKREAAKRRAPISEETREKMRASQQRRHAKNKQA